MTKKDGKDGGKLPEQLNAKKSDFPEWMSQILSLGGILDNRYDYLRKISGGTGRAGLSLKILSKIEVPYPKLEEQKKISEILESITISINTFQEHRQVLYNLRKKLNNDLFSDKMDLKELLENELH